MFHFSWEGLINGKTEGKLWFFYLFIVHLWPRSESNRFLQESLSEPSVALAVVSLTAGKK